MKNNNKKKIMAYWKKREIEEALFDRRIRQYTIFHMENWSWGVGILQYRGLRWNVREIVSAKSFFKISSTETVFR